MQTKPEENLFEYAVVRYCPDAEREEFLNVGLVMMCKRRRWLKCGIRLERNRLLAIWPETDLQLLESQLAGFQATAEGRGGVLGSLEAHERFRWLTAVRSACIRTSRPHAGLSVDLDADFDRLLDRLVSGKEG